MLEYTFHGHFVRLSAYGPLIICHFKQCMLQLHSPQGFNMWASIVWAATQALAVCSSHNRYCIQCYDNSSCDCIHDSHFTLHINRLYVE